MIKNITKYIIGFFALYLIWALFIPFMFQHNADKIKAIIYKNTQYEVEFENPRISTASIIGIKFYANSFSILNKDTSKALSVEKPVISIKLLPIVCGKLRLERLEAKNIEANFNLKDKLYLGDYEIKQSSDDIKADKIKIDKYTITLFDNNTKLPIHFVGQDLYYKENFNNIFAHSTNKLYIKQNISDINFDVKIPKKHYIKDSRVNLCIKNLILSPFSNTIKSIYGPRFRYIDGKINLLSDNSSIDCDVDNFKIIMSDSARSLIFPQKLKLQSKFTMFSKNINFDYLKINGGNIHFETKGNIENYLSDRPFLDLDMNIPKSDIREFAVMMPPIVEENFNAYRLKMHKFYGDVEGYLNIKGKLPEPNIDGNIKIWNAYVTKPIKNADKATININCEEKHMNIDVVVPASYTEKVYVTGSIEDYGENAVDLRIRSTKKVDLSITKYVLDRVHEIMRFLMGPVPIMQISGIGNVNVRVIGTKRNPHIWGDFNFINTTASFDDIRHFEIKNATGNLNFNDQNIHFINNTGTVMGQPFTIEGRCSVFGDLDFDVTGNNQPLQNLINMLKDSPMLLPVRNTIPNLEKAIGNCDFKLKITGKVYDLTKINICDNINIAGSIKLKGNSIVVNKIPIKKNYGDIKFKNKDIELNLKSIIDNLSSITTKGCIKDNKANIQIDSSSVNIREFVKEICPELDDCYIYLKAKYNGTVEDIEPDKLDLIAKVLRNNKPVKNIKISTGNIEIKHSKVKLQNIHGFVKQNPFDINLSVSHLDKNIFKSRVNGNIYMKNFDLKMLNHIKSFSLLPQSCREAISPIELLNGKTNINATIKNNKINTCIDLSNISARYKIQNEKISNPLYIPIKLINGQIVMKDNRIFLNKLNCLADNMPVLIYGNIKNMLKNPVFDIHINSKLQQEIFNKYWNNYNIYPIKVKGDIILGSRISGTKEELNTTIDAKLEEQSSIYYMGATIGDMENPITVNSDIDFLGDNLIRLNKFQYSKLISSQNNKQNIFPLLTINGGITYNKQYYKFNNLTIKTDSPTDARIFNIVFKKPTIKHGQFTSDLKINGKSTSPKIIGNLLVNGLDMPFLNTTIKDLSFDFKENDVFIQSKGEILSNSIKLNAHLKNKFTANYDVQNADISLKHMDLESIVSQLKQLELKTFNNTTSDSRSNFFESVIFKKLNIHADSISVKNIQAKNLNATCSLNNKMQLAINNFEFDVADGNINGNMNFNLLNNFINLKLYAHSVNANDLMIAFLDLPNQIYGKLTGVIEMSSNLTTESTSKETLCGNATFTIREGRMPKLGSLEYMLKAANLAKSGITGITMNSLVDIITPLKTGAFSNIDGNIVVQNGIAQKIEVHSKSKDLNLYIKGQYNVITRIANLLVFGQLSRKVSTAFGAVGNLSLNSLFNTIPGVDLSQNGYLTKELNKIPGIELSGKAYRKFIVEIFGDLNSDSNVKTFKWITE